ncbi:MAG TPA: biotin--[acetyl-CoA-carboxylase] ligase, partial [Planctomycetota bacterium]|nr:biotin--[acetyl-CoA-carboxylase] ligase [Planctomycetota bacterium]
TAGRGRRGATWVSPPGAGLYMSLVLRPKRVLEPAATTMGAGLAMRAALVELGLARVELKWPNDLLVDGAKLCGILAETRGLDPRSPHCVLGIGVNVTQREFPAELVRERAVTSLALCGVHTDPRAVLACALPHLSREMERVENDPRPTLQAYFAATGLAGRLVRVRAGELEVEGTWRALDLERGLTLAQSDGSSREIRLEHVRSLVALSLHSSPPET